MKDILKTPRLLARYLRYFPAVNLNRLTPFPLILFLELTHRCNLECVHCDMWKVGRQKDRDGSYELTLSDLEALAAEAARRGAVAVHLYGGEPLLRDDLLDIVRAFSRVGLRVGLTSNGLLLDGGVIDGLVEAGLSRLLLSLDHPEPAEHDALRGSPGLFDRVVACIRHAVDSPAASGLTVEVNTVVHRRNYTRLLEISDLLRSLGVTAHNIHPFMDFHPLRMKPRAEAVADDLRFTQEETPDLAREIGRFYDHLEETGQRTTTTRRVLMKSVDYYAGKHEKYICAIGGVSCDIRANGDVLFCWGSGIPIGNLREAGLGDIWHSPRAKEVMAELRDCTQCVDSCQADLRERFSPRFLLQHSPTLLREVLEMLF